MNSAPHTLPGAPIELRKAVPDAPQSYVDYWPQRELLLNIGENHCELEGVDSLHQLAVAGRAFVRGEGRSDPDLPVDFPDDPLIFPRGVPQSPVALVRAWQRGFGPLNLLPDAEDDLLHGAALLLSKYRNQPSDPFPRATGEHKNVADAFLDVISQIRWSEQRLSCSLLLAGELTHQAAWVEKDTDRQARLFKAAGQIYRREHDASHSAFTEEMLTIGQHLTDLDSHDLSQRIRQARKAKLNMNDLRQEAVTVQQRQLLDFFSIPYMRTAHGEENRRRHGALFHTLLGIGFRHFVLIEPEEIKGNHPEIRTAFRNEDSPLAPRGLEKVIRFDQVISKVTSNGEVIAAKPCQLKSGRSQELRPVAYDLNVVQLIEGRISTDRMLRVGEALLKFYDREQFGKNVDELAPVRELLQPVMSTAKAA